MIDDLAPTEGLLFSVLGVLMSGVNVVGCSLCGRERWKYHHFCKNIWKTLQEQCLRGYNVSVVDSSVSTPGGTSLN